MSVPPPPPPLQAGTSAGLPVGDNRGLLLQSIRTGKTLKKTVTVDKSAPTITGKSSDSNRSKLNLHLLGRPSTVEFEKKNRVIVTN